MNDTKIIIGIGLLTLAIFAGGIFLLQGGSSSPTLQTTPSENAKLVREDSFQIATPSAKVTVVEFADLQCPACASVQPGLKSILEKHKGNVNFVFRHFPLSIHRNAIKAAEAAEAAGEQGKFWEMAETLYTFQSNWQAENNPTELFIEYAEKLGLDTEKFKKDIESGKYGAKIQKGIEDGLGYGVNSTPTFFVNDKKVETPRLQEEIEKVLK